MMKTTSRRDFFRKALIGIAAIFTFGYSLWHMLLRSGKSYFTGSFFAPSLSSFSGNSSSNIPNREAMYYTSLGRGRVRCDLCYRECTISNGRRGFCKNRENDQGKLYNVVYGKPSAVNIDPIEKEPQHHMLPGSNILCIGTAGCNFRCLHCHNWHLSQRSIEEIGRYHQYTPQDIIQNSLKLEVPTISFTYNEPTVFYEYVLDIAKLAKKVDLRILWHSNGYIKPEPLKELLDYTDAVTIDLKGFSRTAYENSSAELEPVLKTLKAIKEKGVWLEIVNLVIPTINDSTHEIKTMCEWIRDELSPEVPLHFSRFFPNYKLTNLSPTPIDTLERAYSTAQQTGLQYVTLGNVPGHDYNSTFCPQCGEILIRRVHFNVREINISNGKCDSCGHMVPGIWK